MADYIDKHTNGIASEIRDAIDSASWIPDSLRPPRHSNGGMGNLFARPPPPPQGFVEQTTAWISRNRTAIAIVVAFTGTSIYLIHRRKRAHARKRRARKLPNGAKREIVVLACSTFHDALTRSLALDLERRGYVVYVTVSSTDEDSLIQQEAKADLRPLWIDLTSTVPNPAVDVHPNLEPIRELLTKSSRPSSPTSNRSFQGSSMGNMTLAGVVVFPGCSGFAEGPLALLPPTDIVDTLNTRLVSPVLTIQQFLPLLANHSTNPKSPASIVIAYPSIPQSLNSPRQIPECLVTSSLSTLASSLRREIYAANANITVSELKMGNFDMGSVTGTRTVGSQGTGRLDPSNSALTQTNTHWHSSQRAAIQRRTLGQRSFIRGSPAREFHNAVFDALAPAQTFKAFGRFEWQSVTRSNVVFVGSGARLYDIIGRYLPGGLVASMMGFRSHLRQTDEEHQFGPGGTRIHPTRLGASGESGLATPVRSPSATWGSTSMASESAVWEKI